ncbi:MAG: hypothetical protein ABI382_01440 [Nakamurella sp.]
MFRTKMTATAGVIATAAACVLFAAPAATAAPTPSPTGYLDCITCWTPRSVDWVLPNVGDEVGSALLRVSL